MKKTKVKNYEDWEDVEPSYIVGTGSYQRVGPPKGDKTKIKQIGFIRQKPKAAKKK